jgi:hypothetical protein
MGNMTLPAPDTRIARAAHFFMSTAVISLGCFMPPAFSWNNHHAGAAQYT